MTDVIWQDTYNSNDGTDNDYLCEVTRTDHFMGLLKIYSRLDPRVFSTPVGLIFGAMWGPDPCDVIEWERICEEFLVAKNEKSRNVRIKINNNPKINNPKINTTKPKKSKTKAKKIKTKQKDL